MFIFVFDVTNTLRNVALLYLCDSAKRFSLSFRLNTGISRVQASVAENEKQGACCLI